MQSFSVTLVGLAANACPPGPGVGQIPAPAPEPFTVIARFDAPSETVTVPLLNVPEGFARLIETMLPLTVAVTVVLFEAAL